MRSYALPQTGRPDQGRGGVMQTCKPDPVSRLGETPTIYLRGLPTGIGRAALLSPAYLALQPARFTPTRCCQRVPWALTPHFHPYLKARKPCGGCFLWHFLCAGVTPVTPLFPRVRCPVLSGLSSPRQSSERQGGLHGKGNFYINPTSKLHASRLGCAEWAGLEVGVHE